MRLHRFFIETPIEADTIVIRDDALMHQWRNVFRYQVGQAVILCDNSGFEYKVVITRLTNREAEGSIEGKRKGTLLERDVWLCLSIIKKDRFEMAVEKATELGVSHIVSILAERSVPVRLSADRLAKIAREASEQCGRVTLPVIHPTMNLEEALQYTSERGASPVLCHEEGKPLSSVTFDTEKSVAIYIGPEGGFTEREIAMCDENDAQKICLGNFTLRAETAGIVGVSCIFA